MHSRNTRYNSNTTNGNKGRSTVEQELPRGMAQKAILPPTGTRAKAGA